MFGIEIGAKKSGSTVLKITYKDLISHAQKLGKLPTKISAETYH